MFNPWGVDDPNSQTATSTGGWTCSRCHRFITWQDGDHDCPSELYQITINPTFLHLQLIAQKLDRIIELLEKR